MGPEEIRVMERLFAEVLERLIVLEEQVAALQSHDTPTVPKRPEANEQGYREGAYEWEHYGWVL